MEDPEQPGKWSQHLDPVCSTNIFDAKARKELQIMDISDTTAPAEGGKKILIFCEKVAREDIKVNNNFNPTAILALGGKTRKDSLALL